MNPVPTIEEEEYTIKVNNYKSHTFKPIVELKHWNCFSKTKNNKQEQQTGSNKYHSMSVKEVCQQYVKISYRCKAFYNQTV